MVLEGRRAITWHEAWGVPAYRFSDMAVSTLRAPEHFEACMTQASPEDVFRCLYDATEPADAVCIPAREYEIG